MRGLMELLTRPHIRTRLGRSRHDACFWHSQIHEMVGRRGTHVTQVWEGRLLPSSKWLDGEFAASIEIKRATIKSEPQPVGASTLSLNLGQSRRLPNFRFWRWCGHADTRSIVLARRAINVRKLCIATISKIELAQLSYGSTWPFATSALHRATSAFASSGHYRTVNYILTEDRFCIIATEAEASVNTVPSMLLPSEDDDARLHPRR
jgi:hypothetical protein